MKTRMCSTNNARTRKSTGFGNRHFAWGFTLVVLSVAATPACFAGGAAYAAEMFFTNSALVISPDDNYVGFVPFEFGPVRTFSLTDGSLVHVFPVENDLTAIDISGDGRLIAAGTQTSLEPASSVLRVWDAQTGEMIGVREVDGMTRFVRFWEDASRLSYGEFGETRSWWEKPAEYWNFGYETEEATAPAPIPPGATITIGSARSSVSVSYGLGLAAVSAREAGAAIVISKIGSSEVVAELPEPDTVRSLFFSGDGSLLAALISGDTSTVRLWETGSWNERPPVVVDGRALQGTLNRDGTLLAIHVHLHRLMILDIAKRQTVLSFSVRLPEEDLYEAAETGNVERVGELIRRGVNVDLPVGEDLQTPLMVATRRGHDEVVELLISAQADVNRQQAVFASPLRSALESDDLETVEVLVDAGADLHGRTSLPGVEVTYLMYAAANCSPEIVSFLIDEGAALDVQTTAGYTALMYAAGFASLPDEMALRNVQLLLEAGADVSLRTWQGKTALDLARDRSRNVAESDLDTVRRTIRLLEHATTH